MDAGANGVCHIEIAAFGMIAIPSGPEPVVDVPEIGESTPPERMLKAEMVLLPARGSQPW